MPVLPLLRSLGRSLSKVTSRQTSRTESSAQDDDLQSVVPKAPTCRSAKDPGTSVLQRRRKAPKLSIVVPAKSASHADQEARGMCSSSLMQQYDMLEVLGQGASALVHKAIRKADKKEVAVKTMQSFDEEMIAVRCQEFKLLKDLKHPNIIKAYDCFVSRDQVALVLEYFSGQTLSEAVRRAPSHQLSELQAKGLGRLLLRAVDYLHQRRIVHRDIKGENLLVSHDLRDLRLIDFNVARSLLEGGALTMTGTHIYAAPEVLNGEPPSEKADIWSVGVCLFLMLTGYLRYGKQTFRGPEHLARTLLENPFQPERENLHSVSKPCKRVLGECLSIDECLRPAAMVFLGYEWFQENAECSSKRDRGRHASLSSVDTAGAMIPQYRATRSLSIHGWRQSSIDAAHQTF